MEPTGMTRAEVETALEAANKRWRDLGEQHRDLLDKGTDGDWANKTDASRAMHILQERDDASAEKNRLQATLDEMPVPRPVSTGKFSIDDLAPIERFAAFGHAKLTAEEIKDHCKDFKQEGPRKDAEGFVLDVGARERLRAATTESGAVSPIQAPGLINRLKHYGDAPRVCRQFMTPYGTELRVTNLDDAGKQGETIAPTGTATVEDLTQFTTAVFLQSRCTSKAMDVHRYAMRDIQGFSVAAEIERAANRRMGREINEKVVTGTGANNLPFGIVPAALPGDRTASSTIFTPAEMVDLRYKVNRAYWDTGGEGRYGYMADPNSGMVGYMVSNGAEKVLVNLEDTQKRPLYLPSVRDGVPDTWNGFPIVVNSALADPAASTKPILFGNFAYYGVRFIDMMEFWRFFDSGNALADTVRFLANMWYDAIPVGARTDDGTGARSTYRFEAVAAMFMKA